MRPIQSYLLAYLVRKRLVNGPSGFFFSFKGHRLGKPVLDSARKTFSHYPVGPAPDCACAGSDIILQ
jgi:hypothetical protein